QLVVAENDDGHGAAIARGGGEAREPLALDATRVRVGIEGAEQLERGRRAEADAERGERGAARSREGALEGGPQQRAQPNHRRLARPRSRPACAPRDPKRRPPASSRTTAPSRICRSRDARRPRAGSWVASTSVAPRARRDSSRSMISSPLR